MLAAAQMLLSNPLLLILVGILEIFGLRVLYEIVIATPARQIPATQWRRRVLSSALNFLVLSIFGAVVVSLYPPIKQPIIWTILQQWQRNVEGGLIGVAILLVVTGLGRPLLRSLRPKVERVTGAIRGWFRAR